MKMEQTNTFQTTTRPVFIGHSPAMMKVYRIMTKVSPTNETVLIMGETGTGKEEVARFIHYNSGRKDKIFVPINCGALAEGVLESELFGHVRGAFTGAHGDKRGMFEIASDGTLFLDEVTETTRKFQSSLYRVLEDGTYHRVGRVEETRKTDARVIAAASRNLADVVHEGTFDQALFYRLAVLPIYLPPLKDRGDDIILLANHFLRIYNQEHNKNLEFEGTGIKFLMEYPWHGNVRELQAIIKRAVILTEPDKNSLNYGDLDYVRRMGEKPKEGRDLPTQPISYNESLDNLIAKHEGRLPEIIRNISDEVRIRIIRSALEENMWKRTLTANKLGIRPATLRDYMKRYNIIPEDY